MSGKKFVDMGIQDYRDILAAIKSSPAQPEALRVFMNCAITEGEAKLTEAERLLKETLTCNNNDRDERGVCCQCREAINDYFDITTA